MELSKRYVSISLPYFAIFNITKVVSQFFTVLVMLSLLNIVTATLCYNTEQTNQTDFQSF